MSAGRACAATAGWPLERVLFAMAGTVSLVAAVLSAFVSPWFLLLVGFVAINQLLYVRFAACGASLILSRFFGLKSALYTTSEESSSR
jgi:hypothetical protein